MVYEVYDYSHCIHNWPVTREIGNSFKFRRVGTACWWRDVCGFWLELLGFCPPLGQFNGVQCKWLGSFAPPTSPGGGLRRLPSLFGMSIVLAVAVPSHNLVTRAGTIGMQCEYYTIVCSQWLLCNLASCFSIFSPSPCGPYGFHARHRFLKNWLPPHFLSSPSKVESSQHF